MNSDLPLGKKVSYPEALDASVLRRVTRDRSRYLGSEVEGKMDGFDDWHAYELSWLSPRGLPQVGILWVRYPARSRYLIESKSKKLYLNSFYNTVFPDVRAAEDRIGTDLTALLDEPPLQLRIVGPDEWHRFEIKQDDTRFEVIEAGIAPSGPAIVPAERMEASDEIVEEHLSTNLLRSLCPITSQPDWGSVHIHYRGKRLVRESFLGWLVSKRCASGFHEQMAEELFSELFSAAEPEFLLVHCYFLRRGGIDICPCRYTRGYPIPPFTSRQMRQ